MSSSASPQPLRNASTFSRTWARTWESLAELGNLSSASVLMVLRDVMGNGRPPKGVWGLMVGMGPGFCSELVLLRW
jgi:alkylresorcinol/alkylpyrone synthase